MQNVRNKKGETNVVAKELSRPGEHWKGMTGQAQVVLSRKTFDYWQLSKAFAVIEWDKKQSQLHETCSPQRSDLCVLRQTVIAARELFVFVQVLLKERKYCQSREAAASQWHTEIHYFLQRKSSMKLQTVADTFSNRFTVTATCTLNVQAIESSQWKDVQFQLI